MAETQTGKGIPTKLSLEQFNQFVLPHLTVGRRGPAPKLSLHATFNYILRLLYRKAHYKIHHNDNEPGCSHEYHTSPITCQNENTYCPGGYWRYQGFPYRQEAWRES